MYSSSIDYYCKIQRFRFLKILEVNVDSYRISEPQWNVIEPILIRLLIGITMLNLAPFLLFLPFGVFFSILLLLPPQKLLF